MSWRTRVRQVVAAGTATAAAAMILLAVDTAQVFPAQASAAPSGQAGGPTVVKGPGKGCDQPLLVGGAKGAAALARLGDDLPKAAARSSMAPTKLSKVLKHDRTARLDRCGSLFHVEPALTVEQERVVSAPLDVSGDAFALHSRPGSQRTIYLDFNGELLSGTAWNQSYNAGATITAPAYSQDTDTTTFTDAERAAIKEVWLRVAEDYAPFDIDVTTADPGPDAIRRTSSTDLVYGTRALITGDSLMYSQCGCGGVAYVGVFDSSGSTHDYYQPALVFTRGVGTGAKNVAEATSHEVGHNLGLSHDGQIAHDGLAAKSYYSGAGAWAPIMGVGYYKAITHWSDGGYAFASNTENDFSVMATNGAAAITDDHGDTTATATDVTAGATTAGTISTRADEDVFTLAASGDTTVTVAPQAAGANLDAKVQLLDSGGAVVASADPASGQSSAATATGLGASLTATLASGRYYVRVSGVGVGDPLVDGYTDFGSLGRYTVKVTTTPTQAPLIAKAATLASGEVTLAYSASLAASGGTAPYSWAVTSGALPPGVKLSTAGAMSGTPTAAGTYAFTATVTDAARVTASQTYSISVVAAPAVTTASLPAGKRRTAYAATLAAAGGTTPYTWSLSSGSLPSGLTLAASTGKITGTPSKAGTFNFTVRVTDARGALATKALSITVS